MPTTDRSCSVLGCTTGGYYAVGMCRFHYNRSRDGRDLHAPHRDAKLGEWSAWRQDKTGYVYRSRRVDQKDQRQLQHRVVVEREIGRRLLPGENVHHINGVKNDNRPENLELWVTHQPSGQRPADLVAWAREILERYDH